MSKRILIVRLSAIGDVVQTLPLASAVKAAYPGCHLGWLVERLSAPLIVGHPLVDWHMVLPRGWLKSPSIVLELRKRLREQKFDIVLDPQGLTKSSVAAWMSGAKTRVGFVRGEAREIAPVLDNRLVNPGRGHVVDMTLSLLDGLGADKPEAAEFVFPPCPDDERFAIESHLAGNCVGERYFLFGPWTTNASKCWPMDRFAQLAARLKERTGVPSLALCHTERECEAVAAAAAADRTKSIVCAPHLSVIGVVELIRHAELFVGCDSFPLHTASGIGVPTVGLFGVSDPERVGPRPPNGMVVHERLTITRSSRAREKLDQSNMLALGVDKVEDACLGLLERVGGGIS